MAQVHSPRPRAGWHSSTPLPRRHAQRSSDKLNPIQPEQNDNLLAALHLHYALRRQEIQRRLQEFRSVEAGEYFYELLYCLLTPQTNAEHAERAVARLRQAGFREQQFDPESIFAERRHYIRFHRTKARHALALRERFRNIDQTLRDGRPAAELREWLAQNVLGLGYKEATHFLRNIGRNDGLAILDRHILRHLRKLGVIRTVPLSLSRKQYLSVERKFKRFAESVAIPLDELDLLFWSMATGSIRK